MNDTGNFGPQPTGRKYLFYKWIFPASGLAANMYFDADEKNG
jgi:hypothetical protein